MTKNITSDTINHLRNLLIGEWIKEESTFPIDQLIEQYHTDESVNQWIRETLALAIAKALVSPKFPPTRLPAAARNGVSNKVAKQLARFETLQTIMHCPEDFVLCEGERERMILKDLFDQIENGTFTQSDNIRLIEKEDGQPRIRFTSMPSNLTLVETREA